MTERGDAGRRGLQPGHGPHPRGRSGAAPAPLPRVPVRADLAGTAARRSSRWAPGWASSPSQFPGLDRHVVTDVDPGAVEPRWRAGSPTGRRSVAAARPARDLPDLGDAGRRPWSPINVLEHIEDDSGALAALARLVEPGGRIVIWVPGYMQLYGDFDRRVGHVRRYTPTTLAVGDRRRRPPLRPSRDPSTCWAASPGGSPCAAAVSAPPTPARAIYDRIVVPVTRALESRVTPPFGQSVLAVATVPQEAAWRQ